MDKTLPENRRIGIIAGTICFIVLYVPLLDVIIRYYQGWPVSLENFITKLLIAMVATALISIFFGYSMSKRDSRLIFISSLIVTVALIAIVCIYSFSTHPLN